MKIGAHHSEDWCHICGKRKQSNAAIWFSKNAEHEPKDESRYLRMCSDCAKDIAEIATHPRSS